MKRLLHITALSRLAAIVTLMMMTIQASAMTYEQAREQALFLTDKMAYELNLSQEQYEAAYEINLDYLMSVTTVDEVYSNYWYQRNIDMEYIMLDWQYATFCATNYFYRPLYWDSGYWHFGIYAYYPHRDFFYFDRPAVYVSYHGAHGWRAGGGRSWYATRTAHYRGVHRTQHIGLRDNYNSRHGSGMISRAQSRVSSNINRQNLNSSARNGYRSSTRTTVGNSNSNINSSNSYRNSHSSRSDNDDMYSTGRSNYRGSNSSSGRQSYSSGNSNINRQSYGSSSSRQGYSGGTSYSGSSSSRQSYSGSSSSNYSGSRGNISNFGGSRSSSSMGTRSSGGMSSGGSRGGGSRGSMGRH